MIYDYFLNMKYYMSCYYFAGRLYALQHGMEIDKKSPDCRTFFVALMDYLETVSFLSRQRDGIQHRLQVPQIFKLDCASA